MLSTSAASTSWAPLRRLGFRDGEVRRAMNEAVQLVSGSANVEALVRNCLRGLTERRAPRK